MFPLSRERGKQGFVFPARAHLASSRDSGDLAAGGAERGQGLCLSVLSGGRGGERGTERKEVAGAQSRRLITKRFF